MFYITAIMNGKGKRLAGPFSRRGLVNEIWTKLQNHPSRPFQPFDAVVIEEVDRKHNTACMFLWTTTGWEEYSHES